MKFVLSSSFCPLHELRELAVAADQSGWEAMSFSDHVVNPETLSHDYPYTDDGSRRWAPFTDWPDPWVMTGALAAVTERLKFTNNIFVLPMRNPFLVAKAISTAAIVSNNRVIPAIGVGWSKDEFGLLQQDFHTRGKRTDEILEILPLLWTGKMVSYRGEFYQFDPLEMNPAPSEIPPIWVGGESRPALRRTAELADGWYPLGSNPTFPMGTPEQLKAGLERLAGYAERFGRDPSTIETIYRTHQFELLKEAAGPDRLPFVGDADQIAGDIRQYQDMGVTSMIWDFLRQTDDLDSMLGLMEDFSTQVWPKV